MAGCGTILVMRFLPRGLSLALHAVLLQWKDCSCSHSSLYSDEGRAPQLLDCLGHAFMFSFSLYFITHDVILYNSGYERSIRIDTSHFRADHGISCLQSLSRAVTLKIPCQIFPMFKKSLIHMYCM